MQQQQHSDFLPWMLTAAAVLIMAVAVRIGAKEPRPPQPPLQPQSEASAERGPARAELYSSH